VDVAFVIKQRLEELGLDQGDLARAANVTGSYVSQLLTRKKAPPAPDRTEIYDRMDRFLKLPHGELARVAELHRREELKRRLGDAPAPLFADLRELILRKCPSEKARHVRAVFERQPFGELERLVAQKLLEVAKRAGKRDVARTGADVFHLSGRHLGLLDSLIDSWDVDLATLDLTVVSKRRAGGGGGGGGGWRPVTRFEYVERDGGDAGVDEERGLREFLRDPELSGSATEEELEFLKDLRFHRRRPTALYYYRELQNLRDPLHFQAVEAR
jgi:transcriptional regulator with XRE-family HTH domain